jgi:hypothetical protein
VQPASVGLLVVGLDTGTLLGDQSAQARGTGQLGVRDELRPLAPIVTADGALVIGDPVNSRWIVVSDGGVRSVPTDANEFVWDSVLGVDGSLYSLVYTWSNKGLVNGRVDHSRADTMELIESYPQNVGECCRRLGVDEGFANTAGAQVTSDAVLATSNAGAPMTTPGAAGTFSAAYPDGTTRTWALPRLASALPAEVHPLPTGELVLVQPLAGDPVVSWVVHLLRLDGTAATETITLDGPPGDNIGKLSVGPPGVLALDRVDASTFRVLRFPLPTVAASDPAAPVPWTSVAATSAPATSVAATGVAATEPLAGTVLHRATVGAGEGQLGLDDCRGCDPLSPLAPLAPMVVADGTVIIPDSVNRRWVVVRDGVEMHVPYASDTLVHDAVLGSDGDVYWVEYYGPDKGTTLAAVKHAPSGDLAAAVEMMPPGVAGITQCCRSISYDGSGEPAVEDPTLTLDRDGQLVVRRGELEPTVTATLVEDGTRVHATYIDGAEREWTLPTPGLVASVPSLHVLPDGSIVAIQVSPLSQEARVLHTVNHLRLDGSVTTANLPPGVTTAGTNGHWSVTPDGVTTLVFDDGAATFEVVRFPLPAA